ncbi:type III toxin-antitoxin system ToxN/AbiQ family toxin [Planococcus sp. CAU13]|uniref:type III toxin-antitoxin system ToxN/AbiQ family toxin n=1 Tax=Planococcus sp. CAU13 TaxID=1541197 RepID=UPI00068A180D|nr:type III toxin-antitoxin system ToxN/AbiQ family toxin [Planococcus sp. CAU13]
MKFYRLKDDYITYLKGIDSNVEDNYGEKKAYIGIVLTIGLHNYFAPLSSHKPAHDRRKKNDTFFRVKDRTDETNKLAIIKLNNMVPALPTEIEEMIFSNERPDYAQLLQKEYEYILSHQEQITKQAARLYERVVKKKQSFFVDQCLDFAALEQGYLNYNKS